MNFKTIFLSCRCIGLAFLMMLGMFYSTLSWAHITDICLRNDVECVEPLKTEYRYFYANVHSTNWSPSGGLASISEITEIITNSMQNINGCSPAPGAEALVSDSEMPSCDFVGTGNTRNESGHVNCIYGLSNTYQSRAFSSISVNTYFQQRCHRPTSSYRDIIKQRQITCPEGYEEHIRSQTQAGANAGAAVCARIVETPVDACNATNNPCQVSTGAKLRTETDFSIGDLSFVRHYHSQYQTNKGFGKGWHVPLVKRLSWNGATDRLGRSYFIFNEGFGTAVTFLRDDGVWSMVSGSDRHKYSIQETSSGYLIEDGNRRGYSFDLGGRLISESDPNGISKTFDYDSRNRLVKVTDRYQRSITLTYGSDGLLETVKNPTGATYTYDFDEHRNLTSVRFPDVTPSDDSDNPVKIYHYENLNFPNYLTGITDENGNRYATFSYDVDGKVLRSELAVTTNTVGQEKVELDYGGEQ